MRIDRQLARRQLTETTRRPRRERDERGAVAIFVALLATMLLITAALSVDLGNAWARKRDIQTQVDVSAISAANWGKDLTLFPADTSADQALVAGKVATYMLEDNNHGIGQQDLTVPQLTADLIDGDNGNGEVLFSNGGTTMRVIAPPATVQFGLANVFGRSSVDVQADATVELFSALPEQDVMPFWLPDGCAFGPVDADTTNGAGNGGGGGGGGGGGSGVNQAKAGDFTITAAPVTAAQGADNVAISLSLTPSGGLNGTKTPEVLFENSAAGVAHDIAGTWVTKVGPTWTVNATIGSANVTSTPGTYQLQVKVHNNYSTIITFTVTGAGPLPTTCLGSDRGNFGQLNSPRTGGGNHQRKLALNIATGIDHTLVPFKNAAANNCEKPPLVGAQLDNVVRDGNNCIVGSTGNDGPWIYNGLVGGLEGEKGRLHVDRGATKSGCNGGNTSINGIPLNNDLLSCYLNDGYTLANIAADAGVTTDMLDPSVVDSPRFVWLPVVYATDRSIKDFQPLKTFVPGFITDETIGTNVPGSSNATSNNGVFCNGGGTCNSINKLTVFTFNPDALQESDRSPVIDYDATFGRATVRLVD